MQADLVLIRATDLNLWPVHEPVATVMMQAGLANIDSVMVAGVWRKRDGRLLGVDLTRVQEALRASGERILRELGWLGGKAEEKTT